MFVTNLPILHPGLVSSPFVVENQRLEIRIVVVPHVGPKAYHPSFDDNQLMKLCLLMILCLISDRFIIKILVGA